jgi:hypothetical protein
MGIVGVAIGVDVCEGIGIGGGIDVEEGIDVEGGITVEGVVVGNCGILNDDDNGVGILVDPGVA